MDKVFITGIDGFTGKHLEKHLMQEGWDVYGTVVGKPQQAKHYQCDITVKNQVNDVVALIQPTAVVHIAAVSFAGEANASLIYNVNVIGTENLLEALIKCKVKPKKVILASSATVYGNQGQEVLDESMCPKPVNHYGVSKLAMEHMAANYFDKLDILIARPFNYTGIGQAEHFLIPKIVKHFKEKKKSIELGNIHVEREFNDVGYVCEVYKKLLECGESSEVVNICSNTGVKLLDVIDMMNDLAGYEIKVKVNPAFVRKNEIKSLTGSTSKLYKMIGEVKQGFFKETLEKMYKV